MRTSHLVVDVLERVQLGDGLALAVRRDAKELGARSAAGVEIAFRILRQRPEVRGRGVEELARRRRQRQQAVAAHREILDDPFREIGIIRLRPDAGFGGESRRGEGSERKQEVGEEVVFHLRKLSVISNQ